MNNSISDMYEGNMSPEVVDKFDAVKEFILDKGNHICQVCGTNLILIDNSYYTCPICSHMDKAKGI